MSNNLTFVEYDPLSDYNTTTSTGRSHGWSSVEELLLIEAYSRHLSKLDEASSLEEKNTAQEALAVDYRNAARNQNLREKTTAQIKRKWDTLVQTFKENATRLHSTGSAGDTPLMNNYDKLNALLGQNPTILPPNVYSSHTGEYTDIQDTEADRDSAPSSPVPTPSFAQQVPASENTRPSSTDDEPPAQRRRIVSSTPPSSNNPVRLTAGQLGTQSILTQINDRVLGQNQRLFAEYMDMHEREMLNNTTNTNNLIAVIERGHGLLETTANQIGELIAFLRENNRN